LAVLHFRELVAWQKAMDLVVAVYELSARFPGDERFGLTNQIRRAAVSIPSNIAEGQGRGAGASFGQFLRIALGSLQEVETQLLIAQRLGYVAERDVLCLLDLSAETGRVVAGLLRSIAD
jgi:four helix bundle protein